MTKILSPASGRVVALADVPDPIFSAQMVGAGCAIDPDPECKVVMAPISGLVAKVHPHAFVLLTDDEVGILCHVGIDTVKLDGEGFDVRINKGERVTAGQEMLAWDPVAVAALKGTRPGLDNLSPMIMMAVLDTEPDSIEVNGVGSQIDFGDLLFELP